MILPGNPGGAMPGPLEGGPYGYVDVTAAGVGRLRTIQTAMPIAGSSAMIQKIASHCWLSIRLDRGPIACSRMKLTSDHEPDAMPVIIADCSRGNAYEPTFSATIWNPPPINVDSEIRAMASRTDVVIVVSPSVSETTVRNRNMPIGRGLLAA